ncbi:MAG: MarR family transcriptional regulator [Bacilli bacterium]|nr:MarR family transcriptional regulator [Bacilli bacterium]MDD4077033.1 MarR family transcriptional regulator [Bacilli bacterium]MDD4387639.1 MarR family transcriptional regulator [Bacilli bacterium]
MDYLPHAKELFEVFIKIRKQLRSKKFLENLNFSELIVFGILLKNKFENEDALIQVKELSERMKISRPALNTILNRLEYQDLIKRVRMMDDRRAVFVEMSDKAYKLYQEENAKLIGFLNRIVEKMGAEDIKTTINILNKLYNIMKDEVMA